MQIGGNEVSNSLQQQRGDRDRKQGRPHRQQKGLAKELKDKLRPLAPMVLRIPISFARCAAAGRSKVDKIDTGE